MKKLTYSLAFVILCVLISSCVKSDLPSDLNTVNDPNFIDVQFQTENFGNPAIGSFMGVIEDEVGNTLESVQIQIGNAVTTTDRNGVFIMNNVDVFENFAYIKAEKVGYISGSRVVIPKPNGVNRVKIQLLLKEPIATIMSGETSEVSIAGGVNIKFEGDFITKADGNSYNGPVEVVAQYLYPNSGATFFQMPGNLFAQTASNSARSLETYGMVSVSLFSPSNQPLNIDPNSTATIEFPIDFNQTDIAPETIPLWSFDEEVGYWKEEGEATKVNNKYVAEVNHFSWWNCDIPMDFVELCFTIEPSTSTAASSYIVALQRTFNDQYIYYGYATSGEAECGWIPKGEAVKVQIFAVTSGCSNQLVYEETVGGFSTDSSIDISFNPNGQVIETNITGTVTNCSGMPLTDGYLYVDGDNISSITDGIIDISVQHCANENATLQIFDSNTGQWAYLDVPLNGTSVEIGSLSTCGDTGGIYNGDVTLNSQEEVNEFALFNYSVINGDLRISPDYTNAIITSDITDLSLLSSLEQVNGRVIILSNDNLQNLNGLTNLTSVGWLTIGNNESLTSLAGIQNIQNVSWFNLYGNDALTSLDDLQSWDFDLRILSINRNSSLTSISGLSNVRLYHTVYLEDLADLTTFEELNFADTLNTLQIRNNDALTSLPGLENITSIQFLYIGGNDNLQNLEGLENLIEVSGFFIGVVSDFDIFVASGNPALTDYCAVRNLFLNGTFVNSSTGFSATRIENNVFNPTIQNIQDGNCSI